MMVVTQPVRSWPRHSAALSLRAFVGLASCCCCCCRRGDGQVHGGPVIPHPPLACEILPVGLDHVTPQLPMPPPNLLSAPSSLPMQAQSQYHRSESLQPVSLYINLFPTPLDFHSTPTVRTNYHATLSAAAFCSTTYSIHLPMLLLLWPVFHDIISVVIDDSRH